MLDPRLKGLHLIISYVGHENSINLVVDYDLQLLLPLLLKAYKSLMPNAIDEP